MIFLHQDRGFCHIDDLLGMDINHNQEGEISEESYSRILLLHELGAIVHFDEPTLKDLIILDPEWLTKVCVTTNSHQLGSETVSDLFLLRELPD